MANKRYDQFPTGTYNTAKIFLQADSTTGALEKINLPSADTLLPSQTGNAGKFLTTNGSIASWGATAAAWSITGNAGTDGGTVNFFGTTDNKDVVFKMNNTYNCTFYALGGMSFKNRYSATQTFLAFGVANRDSFEYFISGGVTVTDSWNSGYRLTFGNATNRLLTISSALVTVNNFSVTGSLNIGTLVNFSTGNTFFDSTSPYLRIKFNGSLGWGCAFTNNSTNVLICNSSGKIDINPAGAAPIASAALSVTSTSLGFAPPRMTTAQKNAISTPAEGLIVYDTTLHKLCLYTGSVWETITSS